MRKIFDDATLAEEPDYKLITSEAHKQPAIPVGAPSLIWHITLAFDAGPRVQENRGKKNIELAIESREAILNSARAMADKVYSKTTKRGRRARSFFPDISLDTEIYKFQKKNICWSSTDSEVIIGGVDGNLIKFSIMIHNDYITMTTILDLSKSMELPKDQSNDDVVYFDGIIDAAKVKDALRIVKEDLLDQGKFHDPATATARQYIYNGFWNDVSRKFFDDFKIPGASSLDRVFGDFRGLVLLKDRESEVHLVDGEKGLKEISSDEGHFKDFGAAKAAACRLETLFKIANADFDRSEFATCTVLRHRAVYFSPLGGPLAYGKPEVPLRQRQHKPVEYAFLVGDQHRWQIGRLVHRINQLGTLRVLALRDLDRLRIASLATRVLGSDLDDITHDLTNIAEAQSLPQKDGDPGGTQPASGQVQEEDADLSLSKVEDQLRSWFAELSELERSVTGGIAYRIGRSRYFATSFDTMVKDLDIHRIEGWQPYNEFVRRRLFAVYEFIGRLGDRMMNLRRRAESVNQRVHIARMKEATVQNRKLNESIAASNKALVSLEGSIDASNKNMADFQKFETIVEFIIFTYYGGFILKYLVVLLIFPVSLAVETTLSARGSGPASGDVLVALCMAFMCLVYFVLPRDRIIGYLQHRKNGTPATQSGQDSPPAQQG